MSKTAFLFPGQGAQYVGMGQQAAESLPAARALYDRAATVLGYDLAKLCFEGPAEEPDTTVYSQPALYTLSIPDFLNIPVLAAEAPPAAVADGDGFSATIPLRTGMTWSDGEPVDANDFVFTFDIVREFELGSNWISNTPEQVTSVIGSTDGGRRRAGQTRLWSTPFSPSLTSFVKTASSTSAKELLWIRMLSLKKS